MTAEVKNLYENIIEDMIIDGINGMTPDLKKMIKTAPVEKKRELILNIMEENNPEHRLLCNKINKVVKENNLYTTKHIKNVVQMLREYVKVSAVEKKQFGEIMTPIELVEEMLDTLPNEVWSNPDLKWLDPCNGVGTFVSVIINRLMKGLSKFQPVEELRYKHIMENMIYVCELQAKNMFLFMYAFDPKDEFALNIYNGSYLDNDFNQHMSLLGIDKFDIIVMNPPYQELKEGFKRAKTIWDKFVIKTVDQLIEGGYLIAVHPSSWRGLSKDFNNVKNLLKSKQISYLEMHNTTDGLETFGANTTYDFYCLHNVPTTMFTKIKTYNGTIERADISEMEFIPNVNIEFVFSFIAKKGEEKIKILHDSSYHYQNLPEQMSKEQTEEFKYPCAYTVGALNPNFIYSNTNKKGHFGIPKVIWGNGLTDVIIDEKGEYGLTQFAYAIVDEPKNLPFIQKALKSDKFIKEVMGYVKGVGHIYDYKVIATFRKDFWVDFLG